MSDIYSDKDSVYYNHTRKELLEFIPPSINSALDVGCGTGNFGQMLKQIYQCEVWGIEPNEEAASQASTKIDKSIHGLFSLPMPELAEKKFDAIFFNDVLEHMEDPESALRNCHNLLTPNGCILASIPNIRWYPVILSLLRYKDFRYQNAGVMDKTHLRFFTMKSMQRLFTETGFEVVRISGINKDKGFKYFNILNLLLLNTQWDMKFPQFAIVAKRSC